MDIEACRRIRNVHASFRSNKKSTYAGHAKATHATEDCLHAFSIRGNSTDTQSTAKFPIGLHFLQRPICGFAVFAQSLSSFARFGLPPLSDDDLPSIMFK